MPSFRTELVIDKWYLLKFKKYFIVTDHNMINEFYFATYFYHKARK